MCGLWCVWSVKCGVLCVVSSVCREWCVVHWGVSVFPLCGFRVVCALCLLCAVHCL